MKALVYFLALFYCLPIPAQDFIKQISQIDNNARNLRFILSNPYESWDINNQYVFESHSDSSINIVFGDYDAAGDSFYNQYLLTNNGYQNKNATGRYFSYSLNTFIIYQSNRNGNWDLFSLVFHDSIWSEEKLLFDLITNETDPIIIRDNEFFFADDSVRFLYKSSNSVFLATWQDSIIRNIEIFTGNDSISYSSYDASYYYRGFNNPLNGHYIAAQKNGPGLNRQIVYRILDDGGLLSPENVIAESPTLSNTGYSIFNFQANLHYEEIINNKKNILIYTDWPYSTNYYSLLKDNPGGHLSDFTSIPILIVTDKPVSYKPDDLFIYECHSFKQTSQDSTFIRLNLNEFEGWQDTLIYTHIPNSTIDVGELGFDGFYMVFYTAWEDSVGDKVGIFGRKQLFNPGSVQDGRKNNSFELQQNYPNPFNPVTNIRYNLTERGVVVIKVYDVLGKEIKTLVDREQSAGEYQIDFDGSDLTSGVYFYRMQNGKFFQTKKMILLR
jgi:hypothetical protein